MNKNNSGNNYLEAKSEADKVDLEIINALKDGVSFRVEAGAGSGKTYSLNKAIEWIQSNKWGQYRTNDQNVVCITYTNAAVNVINERLSNDSFIIPSTIHSFAWSAIKQFQGALKNLIAKDKSLNNINEDFSEVIEIRYTLGHRYVEEGIYYLHHNDVLILFEKLLDNTKFRKVFSDKYPLILIDEYQDSYKPVIDKFLEYFISTERGPQFGFFGDAWQTIYQLNQACGLIENEKLRIINKGSNFRSAPRIVKLLNALRPELPQKSAIDDFQGKVVVVTCDDYSGKRRKDWYFRDDLPVDELKRRIDTLKETIKSTVADEETLKILMITHKVLATQQGYRELLEIINDGLREKQDQFLLYFMNTVEPIYESLCSNNMQLLFDTLGVKQYPITAKVEKTKWKELQNTLAAQRNKKAIDVLNVVKSFGLIPIPPIVESYIDLYNSAPDTMYNSSTIKEVLDIEYSQFVSAIEFLYPSAEYSTEHGVKGEEYDNVVFVISKGWNQYKFEEYAPMINGIVSIPPGEEKAFEKNRNLFYVCCSRPKKRLIIFITVPVSKELNDFLKSVVEVNDIYTYSQFIDNLRNNAYLLL